MDSVLDLLQIVMSLRSLRGEVAVDEAVELSGDLARAEAVVLRNSHCSGKM